MAEDDDIPVRPDVASVPSAIVKSDREAGAAITRMTGKPPNEETYWCMSCGFVEDQNNPRSVKYPSGLTLKFDDDEMEALGGDLSQYTGPCPVCKYMTLVPKSKFGGGTIQQDAMELKKKDWQGQAGAIVDAVKQEIAGGSIFSGSMSDAADAADAEAGHGPPGADDLPDAGAVEDDDLKPRES